LRLSEFLDNRRMKLVRLSSLLTRRLYALVDTHGKSVLEPGSTRVRIAHGTFKSTIPVTAAGIKPETIWLIGNASTNPSGRPKQLQSAYHISVSRFKTGYFEREAGSLTSPSKRSVRPCCYVDHDMAQHVSLWRIFLGMVVRSQAIPCWICGRQSGTGTGFPPLLDTHCIHLPSTLRNLSIKQLR